MNALLNSAEKVDRKDLTHEQRGALKGDFERIARWFDDDFDRDGAQGLAVFAAGLDNFWTTLALPEPVQDRFKVSHELFLAPLVRVVARADGTIVAVVGREQGQLYRLSAGRLQELGDYSDETPGRHDQGGWSQARYQRHIEHLVQEHLKEVADQLDRRVRRLQSPRIVVVSTEEVRAELEQVFSHEVKDAIVGWTQAEAHAPPAQLLEAARPILEEWHANQERGAAERWREETGRGGRATAGWPATLEAASDARVDL